MAAYTITEANIFTLDATRLYAKTFKPHGNHVGTITFVHGYGEHIGRYDHLFDVLCKAGFVVNAFDQRGHGKSEGPRGYTPSVDTSLSDISLIASKVEDNLPHFLYGHSMGGGFSLLYLERIAHSFTGAIITDPLIKLCFTPPRTKVFAGRIASKLLPTLRVTNELQPTLLSHDPEIAKKYITDPMVMAEISTRMGAILLDMGDWIIADAKKINVPILFVHGTADQITSHTATEQVFNLVSSTDKTLKLFEGWFHEPHNEVDKEQLFTLLTDWLKNHGGVQG